MTPIILQGVQHFCPQTCFCSIHIGMGRTADFVASEIVTQVCQGIYILS